jgi:hypothetical protein
MHHRSADLVSDSHIAQSGHDQQGMTARFHSIAVHRYAVPAWLLAAVLAAVIALALVAVLDNPAEPVAAPTQAPPTCIDSATVGHC